MALELPYGYKNLNPEGSSNVDESYGYYNSIAEALQEVPLAMRKGGRTVGIKQADGKIVEYWWENDNDLTDSGLVVKNAGGGGGDFNPAEHDLDEFKNESSNPYARMDDLPPAFDPTYLENNIQNLENNKVDKEPGKGLSDENFSLEEKEKLANIEEGAQVNVIPDWGADTSNPRRIDNKPTKTSDFINDGATGVSPYAEMKDLLQNVTIVNILDFGAVGNGTTESAQFIQDALDFAETNGFRRVYAPSGEYLLEKTVYIPTEIEFFGDGMDKTIFKIDAQTVLDTIEMFAGSTHYQNFYTPVISTKTTRTGATLNNILLKDFKIDDIYYDDTGLTTQVCPMLILNTKNSKIENIEFGNVQTEVEQDGTSIFSLGLSTAFSENILIDKCVHGFAGYEVVSIRFLSKNITTRQNVFNIDKPSNLSPVRHALQVARPTSLVSELQSAYGEEKCQHYTSDGDVFNLVAGVWHAITVHSSDYITVSSATVNALGGASRVNRVFKFFEDSNNVICVKNIINYIESADPMTDALFESAMIGIETSHLNNESFQVYKYVVSDNIINVELNRDLSSLAEREITALIGNLRAKFHNATITDNVVNITGTGVRDQAVFGFYGTNIIASGNVVNFDGTVSQNMRAFVVEGGDRINVINNSTTGNHAYSLKVNYTEILSNFINGVNNFTSEVLNNQKSKTKTVAYIEDGLPISVFNQITESSVLGDSGINLIQPNLGIPILTPDDLKSGNSFKGEVVLNIDNNSVETTKVITLFRAEVYNNTNPSPEITTKITFTLDFLNQDGDDIDYKLSWQYVSSGEVLFGEHTGTIDSTDNHIFDLLVTGDSTDNFTLKQANLMRITDSKGRAFTGEVIRYNLEVKKAFLTAVGQGYNVPSLSKLQKVNTLISNLKEVNLWDKLDVFSIFQLNDSTLSDFALYDYKRDTFMTSYGGMIYDEFGYQGNGIDGYIDTEFNPSTDAANYTLNDASRFFWLSKNPTGAGQSYVDVSSNTPNSGDTNYFRIFPGTTRMFINQGTTLLSGGNVDSSGLGFKAINRTSSTDVAVFNSTTKNARTATSSEINNAKQLLFTSENGYSDMGLSFYAMGASLTDQDVEDIITFYNEYLTEIGL